MCIHLCVHGLNVFYIIVQKNNIGQNEKGGDENIVKCATVRPMIYSFFYFTMTAR